MIGEDDKRSGGGHAFPRPSVQFQLQVKSFDRIRPKQFWRPATLAIIRIHLNGLESFVAKIVVMVALRR